MKLNKPWICEPGSAFSPFITEVNKYWSVYRWGPDRNRERSRKKTKWRENKCSCGIGSNWSRRRKPVGSPQIPGFVYCLSVARLEKIYISSVTDSPVCFYCSPRGGPVTGICPQPWSSQSPSTCSEPPHPAMFLCTCWSRNLPRLHWTNSWFLGVSHKALSTEISCLRAQILRSDAVQWIVNTSL